MMIHNQRLLFATLPLDIYKELANCLDGPELVQLLRVNKRISSFLLEYNKRWKALYESRYNLQHYKERTWFRWFLSGCRGPKGLSVPWALAYCLRWQTEQNIRGQNYNLYSVDINSDMSLRIAMSRSSYIVLDSLVYSKAILLTLPPPHFAKSTLTFTSSTDIKQQHFNYADYNYHDKSHFRFTDHYLVARRLHFEPGLHVRPLGRGTSFHVECGLEDNYKGVNPNRSLDGFETNYMTGHYYAITSSYMDIGSQWCLAIVPTDPQQNGNHHRVYHLATRRWCSEQLVTPMENATWRGARLWREYSNFCIVAILNTQQSNDNRRQLVLQLWQFSLIAVSPRCIYTKVFLIQEDLECGRDFNSHIYRLPDDWLHMQVTTATSLDINIFYQPEVKLLALSTALYTNNEAYVEIMDKNCWRTDKAEIIKTQYYILDKNRIAAYTHENNMIIYSLLDGTILWRGVIGHYPLRTLLNEIIYFEDNGQIHQMDLEQYQSASMASSIGKIKSSERYLTTLSSDSKSSLFIYDFSF
ncbi:hypothetical protein BDF19DRAFT_445762 [Syncephalis fuscata]|nr:hypothetical protein BDF19DRAFT_445762 [Syncephalis fuscata]